MFIYSTKFSKYCTAYAKTLSTLAIQVITNKQKSSFSIKLSEGEKFLFPSLENNVKQLMSNTLIEASRSAILPGEITKVSDYFAPDGYNLAIRTEFDNQVTTYFGWDSDSEGMFFWLNIGMQNIAKAMLPGSTITSSPIDFSDDNNF